MTNPEIKVLDKGFVRLIDHMGSDLSVVNAARVSFGKTKEAFEDSDAKLVDYLAEHEHTSPFRHTALTLHVKAPIFVFRQWMKHRIGSEFNEISGRYVEFPAGDAPSAAAAQPATQTDRVAEKLRTASAASTGQPVQNTAPAAQAQAVNITTGEYIPQWDQASAIAHLNAQQGPQALRDAWKAIKEDWRLSNRGEPPLDVEAVFSEIRSAMDDAL